MAAKEKKKDKDGADSAGEIGEEEDRNWRVLLRIGRARLQPVAWFTDALINNAKLELEGWSSRRNCRVAEQNRAQEKTVKQ